MIAYTPPRVFCFEPCKNDISKAADFGEVVYLFGDDSRRPNIWDTEPLQECIDEALRRAGYRPDVDFILFAGGQVPIATLLAVAITLDGGCNVLFYDAAHACYVERALGLAGYEDEGSSSGDN
jgi:hypothetical protein